MPTLIIPTLANLRSRVRFYIDEVSQANFTDSDINYAINDAQQELATELTQLDEQYLINPTPTTITFDGVTQNYTLASDFFKMSRMQDGNTGVPIDFTDMNGSEQMFGSVPPLVINNMIGVGASIVGNTVRFNPLPTNAGSTVLYWYVPTVMDLTLDTDTSSIPRQYVDMLAILAAIDCKIKDEDDTGDLRLKYQRRLDLLKRTARDRQQQNPKRVRRVSR